MDGKQQDNRPVSYESMTGKFDFQDKGDGYIGVIEKNSLNAAKAFYIGKDVLDNITYQQFPQIKDASDNEADAFRHALWSYKMTKEMGPKLAKEMGDAHERHGMNIDTKGERLMDLHNNQVGRDLAMSSVSRRYGDVEMIHEALKNGLLRTSPYNVPGDAGPPPDSVLQGRHGITATGNMYYGGRK